MVLVEVLEALPGRPISGERLVRPDGKISLGFYGDVHVAGLTIQQVKEKIVRHMRKYLEDDALGLVEVNPKPGEPEGRIEPKDSDRVFVDVTAYNSRNYYVEGEVATPGRLPITGSDHVLDVIHYAGGLLPTADKSRIKLLRNFPKGSPVKVLPVDYEEIAMGTDSSTNYPIMPYDRLVVPRDPTAPKPLPSAEPPSTKVREAEAEKPAGSRTKEQTFERRLNEMDKKLDAILRKLDDPRGAEMRFHRRPS